MAVAVDTTHALGLATASTSSPVSLPSVVVASGATCLIVELMCWTVSATTAMTYGGVSMTKLTSGLFNGTAFEYSLWYLFNPTVGTANVLITNTGLQGNTFISSFSLTGSNTTSQAAAFGTPVETEITSSPPNFFSATATGAGANDMYVGMGYYNRSGINANNGDMVQIYTDTTTFSGNNVMTNYIPGNVAGTFAYAYPTGGIGNSGMAFGVACFGAVTTANPADGASIIATVSTGTGGLGMIAVTAGQQIDVLAFAHVVIANTCTCADQLGNTYTQMDRFNDTATNHNDFYRFRCTVTVPGTPVITATYGSTPASFNIAAAVLSGIYTTAPFTAGQIAHQRQATPSGTDNQSSTATPILASQPSILAGWGFSEGETSAPTVGTGFTILGVPVWGTPFAGVCCTYETKALSTTGPATVTYTPVDTTHAAYTFAAVFNLPPPPVTPFTKTQFFAVDTVLQQ